MLYQDDDFGQGGLAGIQDELPASQIVAKQSYQAGVTTLAPQVTAIKASGAKVMVDFTVPIYTAIAQLTSFTLGYKPQLAVSNVGIDPTTVGALLKTISKGKASGTALIEGAITDGYLPSSSDTSNPWIQLFMKVHAQYDASAPFDGNVEYGMAAAYTFVQALQAAGKNLTRQGLVDAIDNAGASWQGPGLVPFRYTKTQHGGYGGTEMGQIRGGKIVLFGGPLTTDPTPSGAITAVLGHAARAAGQRRPQRLIDRDPAPGAARGRWPPATAWAVWSGPWLHSQRARGSRRRRDATPRRSCARRGCCSRARRSLCRAAPRRRRRSTCRRRCKLTDAQLAGQRVIYSYSGLTPPARLLAQIRAGQAAGVIFFSDNIASIGPDPRRRPPAASAPPPRARSRRRCCS